MLGSRGLCPVSPLFQISWELFFSPTGSKWVFQKDYLYMLFFLPASSFPFSYLFLYLLCEDFLDLLLGYLCHWWEKNQDCSFILFLPLDLTALRAGPQYYLSSQEEKSRLTLLVGPWFFLLIINVLKDHQYQTRQESSGVMSEQRQKQKMRSLEYTPKLTKHPWVIATSLKQSLSIFFRPLGKWDSQSENSSPSWQFSV